jgi:hypothetical protein
MPSIPPEIIEIAVEDLSLSNLIDVNDLGEVFNNCGYTGGVNVLWSDLESHYDLEPVEDEWEDSDTESLAELEGDELEDNLWSLREEVEQLSVPTPYTKITKKKSARE